MPQARPTPTNRPPAADPTAEKLCPACGRRFAWRRKWKACWEQVRYCSDACRRRRTDKRGQRWREVVIDLLRQRRPGTTICPSEAARRLQPDDWRRHMEDVRRAARQLAAEGQLEICQRGQVIDPTTIRGPIRLRLPASATLSQHPSPTMNSNGLLVTGNEWRVRQTPGLCPPTRQPSIRNG